MALKEGVNPGQFDSRFNRRAFIKGLAVLAGGTIVSGAVNSLGPFKTLLAAPENKAQTADILTSFADIISDETAQRANPDEIGGFTLTDDGSGNSIIWVNAAKVNDPNDPFILYGLKFNSSTGKYEKIKYCTAAISAQSVGVVGLNVVVGGQSTTEWNTTAALSSTDGGHNLNALDTKIPRGQIKEVVPIPGTTKMILNVVNNGSIASSGYSIVDYSTGEAYALTGGTGGGLIVSKVWTDPGTGHLMVRTYSKNHPALDGYLRTDIDLTAKSRTTTNLHDEDGSTHGFFATADNNGNLTKLIRNNDVQSIREITVYDNPDSPGETKTTLSYSNWLDGRGIPNYFNGSLNIRSLYIIGNTVYAAGGYNTADGSQNRAVLISWDIGQDPSVNPAALKVFPLEQNVQSAITKQGDLKWGQFNGKYGFIAKINGVGLRFIETNADGTPLNNPTIIYLKTGEAYVPPTATPTVSPSASPTSEPSATPTTSATISPSLTSTATITIPSPTSTERAIPPTASTVTPTRTPTPPGITPRLYIPAVYRNNSGN